MDKLENEQVNTPQRKRNDRINSSQSITKYPEQREHDEEKIFKMAKNNYKTPKLTPKTSLLDLCD